MGKRATHEAGNCLIVRAMDNFDRFVASTLTPYFDVLSTKAHLTNEERDIFYDREFRRWSIAKTALKTFCSEATVKRRYSSARKKLNNII